MVKKDYNWVGGAELDEHSKRKHKVLKEYLTEYLRVRCQHPNQERFRIAIVDGFCGAGVYGCGTPGSPLIILDVLKTAATTLNIERNVQGLRSIQIDVLLILNDVAAEAVELCKESTAPYLAEIKDSQRYLSVDCRYFSQDFELAYPEIKQLIKSCGHNSNVFFNLDQCGHSQVLTKTISDILSSYPSPEILLTFAIQAFLTYLPRSDKEELASRLARYGVSLKTVDDVEECQSDHTWLGEAERTVFETFRGLGAYTSPFSINNPIGWRYWLIHFAKNYRARQVYNDVLHKNSSSQAHFGRSGLNMLSYDPDQEGSLYLFEAADRERATIELHDDIPRAIANFGDAVEVGDFYQSIYNHTPSHSDDIHQAIIENPDLSVITQKGGERRVSNTIRTDDVLKLKPQRNFFHILFPK